MIGTQLAPSQKMIMDLMDMLTIHEEEILKHLTEVANFDDPKERQAYSLFAADHHKMIDGQIRRPAHVATMYSYEVFLWLVAAINSSDTTAYQDEGTVWTSRGARELYQQAKAHLQDTAKPQWLVDAEEDIKQRKIDEDNKRRAAPGEPSEDDDDEEEESEENSDAGDLEGHKPKKCPKDKEFYPHDRKVGERPPRNWLDDRSKNFNGCTDRDRKAGVMAVFMNASGTRKNTHFWCVCDNARAGHWVNTQGNHSDYSQTHPNALKKGFALSSPNKQYYKPTKQAAQKPRKATATASSAGSTVAEADLRIAKANITALHEQLADVVKVRDDLHLQLHKAMALGNDHLITAARTANDMAGAHAKALRKKDEDLNDSIAKMELVRGHAHQFAELVLEYATQDAAPDKIACWNSFSGLLDDGAIKKASWGDKQPRPASSSSRKTYDISKFEQLTTSASMASPAPHVAFQLTAAKAKNSDLLVDYEPLPVVQPIAYAYKGKGKAPAKKRKRDEADDDELPFSDLDEDEAFVGSDIDEDSQ